MKFEVDESRRAGLGTSLVTLSGTDPPIRPEGVLSAGVPLTGTNFKRSVTDDFGGNVEITCNEYGDGLIPAGKVDPVSGICDLIEKTFRSNGGAYPLGRLWRS